MNGLFRLTKTSPSTVRVHSRESCAYLIRVMKYVGWLPPKQGKKRTYYLLWATLAFAYSVIYAPIGFLLSVVMDFKYFTPGEFLGVCQVTVNVFGSTAKSITHIIYIPRLHRMKTLLDEMDTNLKTINDFQKINKAVALCNNIVLMYGKLYIGYILTMFVTGVIVGHPPWMIYNPLFNWRDGAGYFWTQVILENMMGLLISPNLLIVDTKPVVSIIIFRAHADVLKTHIRNLRADPLKSESSNYKDLVSCIKYHKLILEGCNLMRSVMSHTIFIQFLLIGVIFGMTLLNVIYYSGIVEGFATIVYCALIIVETFPFCYLCDLLAKDCEELSNTVGQSNWINAELKYKTTLKIFMHHVQQPITFSAGGIFPISISSNLQVAKFGFSVLTILRQINLADRFK